MTPLRMDLEKQKGNLEAFQAATAVAASNVAALLKAAPESTISGASPMAAGIAPADLAGVQRIALGWGNAIQPELTGVPQAFINYGIRFDTAAASLQTWIGELANENNTNKPQLMMTLKWIATQIDAQIAAIKDQRARIETFRSQLTAAMSSAGASPSMQDVELLIQNLLGSAGKLIAILAAMLEDWNMLKTGVVTVQNDLAAADGDTLKQIAGRFDVATARSEWNELRALAESLQMSEARSFQQNAGSGQ